MIASSELLKKKKKTFNTRLITNISIIDPSWKPTWTLFINLLKEFSEPRNTKEAQFSIFHTTEKYLNLYKE